MRAVLAVAGREIRAYFTSSMGWIVLAVFMAFAGYFFYFGVTIGGRGDLRAWYSDITIILIMLMPALTMRLVAEERQRGSIELLMTAPITDTQAILGKYLGGLFFYGVMLVLAIQYPITLMRVGTPDFGPLWAGFIGLFLFGATFLAIGLFISCTTRSQVVAYVGTFFVLLFMWVLAGAAQNGQDAWQLVLAYLAMPTHLDNFTKGLIDTRDIFFYLSFTGGMLFLSVRSLSAWKWR
jgi:ABC-2 type transport system permease protein